MSDVKVLTAELAQNPDSLVFLRLGDTLRAQGQGDAARKVAMNGLQRHPKLADAHDLYARVLVDDGELDAARGAWGAALELDPRHQGAHKGLGFLYYQLNDLESALDHLELAVAADPTNPSVVQALRIVRRAADAADEVGGATRPSGGEAAVATAATADPEAGVLLVDFQGRALTGELIARPGPEARDAVAAHLAGISQEATRTSRMLGLGDWLWVVVEADSGNAHLMQPTEETLMFMVRDRDVPAGRLSLMADQAAARARSWVEAQVS